VTTSALDADSKDTVKLEAESVVEFTITEGSSELI
jgi:hypothetical protein